LPLGSFVFCTTVCSWSWSWSCTDSYRILPDDDDVLQIHTET
jgi:hypothetical protein